METNRFTLHGQNDEFWPGILGFDPPSAVLAPLEPPSDSGGL